MNRKKRMLLAAAGGAALFAALCVGAGWKLLGLAGAKEDPAGLLVTYMEHIEGQEYEEMYAMTAESQENPSGKEYFLERNANIYGGMEVQNLTIDNIRTQDANKKVVSVFYDTAFDTVAGEVQFSNQANFTRTEEGYKLLWNDGMILPGLKSTDKVQVTCDPAERGVIRDRDGKLLAGKSLAQYVGVIPGKLADRDAALQKLSELLDIDVEIMEKKLSEAWVRDELFVPFTIIPKVLEVELMRVNPDPDLLAEEARQEELLQIPGVMLTDTEVRAYPLEEAAAHLIGYVQGVTAEDLENHPGEGYTNTSVIGKSGMEALYEAELKGRDGYKIVIVDELGKTKEVVASVSRQDGENIRLTIDMELQRALYQQFQETPGCSVALDPYTGEVLALVSTPSFDNNDFIKGLSTSEWTALNEDEKRPLYNRFRQIWCPGSVMKPLIGAIGLETGAIDPDEDFGYEGLSWQKDSSWGAYEVTTLHDCSPANLDNALIYSDNIYFAKAALRIGGEKLAAGLEALGFGQQLPFEITVTPSQYSNTETIETEIQLADSGYGQGQILVNPVHLASLYTAFLNGGNVLKPKLRYEQNASGETWIAGAFSEETVSRVMKGMEGVVNNPEGTGYAAHREDMVLAGKTGTAELKSAQGDTSGTEIGWFCVFSTDSGAQKPVLILSMVENVKELGGSGYVVSKVKEVLDGYLS